MNTVQADQQITLTNAALFKLMAAAVDRALDMADRWDMADPRNQQILTKAMVEMIRVAAPCPCGHGTIAECAAADQAAVEAELDAAQDSRTHP